MRFVYTADLQFDPLPRPYIQLIVGGYFIPALCDTGADHSSIPEGQARAAGIHFGDRGLVVGVGGAVVAYRSAEPLAVTIAGPRLRGRIHWSEFDSFTIQPTIIAGARDLPALIGRLDVLVRYRFTLREREQEFELTKL